ncbi:MAG: zinc-binding dehydrogenase [Actinomycetota bacterium]|nr:zinc-binding dehydrogenase [Actinomycetota bacterium]
MRAIAVEAPGGPEVLTAAEVDLDELGDNEVRVSVDVIGVNYWDVMQRRGIVPLPASRIPGVEGAGRVSAVGPGVNDLAPGARVAWSKLQGSYAEAVQGDRAWFVPIPDDVTQEQAAATLMQGTTAWYLAHEVVPLVAGDVAVVLAAAGGVGHLLCQLLVGRDVTVVGIVGSAAKASVAHAAGASAVLVDSDDVVGRLREHVPHGAAVVFDGNGGPDALRDLAMLGSRGTAVYYGTTAGPLPTLDLGDLTAGSLAVRRVRGADYVGDPAAWRTAAVAVLAQAATGGIRAHIDSSQPLSEAARQHERMESRSSAGKLLLDVEST